MTQPLTTITSLADVRPGDICITRMGGIFPGWFPVRVGHWMCKESFSIGPYSADHVLICVEAQKHYPGVTLYDGERDRYLPIEDAPGPLKSYADAERAGYVVYRTGVITGPLAVQAMPRGAEEITLTSDKHWTDGVIWFRLPEDYPGQAQDAAAIARLFVAERVPYSFLSYLALAAWSRGWKTPKLEAWIDRRGEPRWVPGHAPGDLPDPLPAIRLPCEAICSVLVDQAWSLAGKRVIEGVARQCVTPGMMAIQLNRRPGVIRGGPGFLP